MASRSAIDATRFTATEPHAYSKPLFVQSSSSTSGTSTTTTTSSKSTQSSSIDSTGLPHRDNGTPPPPREETPKEKVARLRAFRLAQRGEQLTSWERTVIRGRVWADRAHRFTALSLIGFTVIAAGVTTFALTDMILHNRRKRKAFYNEQHAIYQARLVAAIETEKVGLPLDDDQVLIMARERAKVQAAERRKEKVWFDGFRGVFTGGLKKEMDGQIIVPSESDMLEKMGVNSVGVLEASEGKVRVNERGEIEVVEETELAKAVRRKRQELGLEEQGSPTQKMGPTEIITAAQERRGGMLDRIGEQASYKADSKVGTGGWRS